MKIVSGFDLLAYVKEKKLLLSAFSTTSPEMTKAIIKGLSAIHLPGMVQISSNSLHLSNPGVIAYMMRELLKGTDTPVGLHLDHGKSFDDIKVCVDVGFTSIVVDASHLNLEENIKEVKKTVEYCHFYHVPMGAGLGVTTGKEDGDVNEADCKADPALIEEFVERSGHDILAVSIGNVHGLDAVAKIDLALLKRIAEVPPVPLVLHGGSGIPSDQVKQVRDYNMTKVNYGSDLRRAFIQAFGEAYEKNHNEVNLHDLSAKVMENVSKVAADLVLIISGLKESQEGINSMYYTGLDIGTSALKTIPMDARRSIVYEDSYGYTILQPQEGWREIDPDVRMQAVMKGLHDIFARCNPQEVSVIGVTGQMHATAFLDKNGEAMRNAIMWTDLRTAGTIEESRAECSQREEIRHIAEILSPGSPAVNTLQIKEHEPQSFARIHKAMTSYTYIVYKLARQCSMDYCEASTSPLYDIATKKWSVYMLDRLGIEESCLGPLHTSRDTVGTLQQILREQLKVSHDIHVIVGTGDNPVNAVAMEILSRKEPVISPGTSGVVIMPKRDMDFEGKGENVLLNVDHTWFVNIVQGTVRSARGTHKWWVENIVKTDDTAADQQLTSSDRFGESSALFSPYITGDKLMYHDLCVGGAFVGLSSETGREDMTQAVLEGISYAIREVLESMKLAQWPSRIQVNGGGTRNPVWMQITANTLHIELKVVTESATPGYGVALLAASADGVPEKEACIGQGRVYAAKKVFTDAYDQQYKGHKRMYNALKNIMQE